MSDEIKKKIIAEGYDGLYYPSECACKLPDLMDCECDEDSLEECKFGYVHYCDECEIREGCNNFFNGSFCIGSSKNEPPDF